MKKSHIITSVLSKLVFPKPKIGNDAKGHKKQRSSRCAIEFLPGYEDIYWRSAETLVTGDVEIVFAHRKKKNTLISLHIPVTTGFLVSYTKNNRDNFNLACGVSLS
jgi:hypothetical protein